MIIVDATVKVFRHMTRRHSDSAGHAHPGPEQAVEQAMLVIRTEDGDEGYSFCPPEVIRPHVLDKFVRKVLIGQDHATARGCGTTWRIGSAARPGS